jgi:transposase
MPLFEYGHAKDHPDLEQIQFSLTLERKRRIPISYDVHPGSIPDVVNLERTLESLTPLVPDIIMILDRGFFSLHNIMALQKVHFIVAVSIQKKEVKAAFSRASRTVDRADNVLIYEDRTLFCQPFTMRMEEIELSGYFYHDPSGESDERSYLHRRLAEKRESIENLQIRRGLRRTVESIAGDFLKYIRYRVENGRIITTARNNAISAAENRMGRFMLVSNASLSAMECLSIYREKDRIEKAFLSLKTDLDVFPLRDHK